MWHQLTHVMLVVASNNGTIKELNFFVVLCVVWLAFPFFQPLSH